MLLLNCINIPIVNKFISFSIIIILAKIIELVDKTPFCQITDEYLFPQNICIFIDKETPEIVNSLMKWTKDMISANEKLDYYDNIFYIIMCRKEHMIKFKLKGVCKS